jgi:hypothetical protein
MFFNFLKRKNPSENLLPFYVGLKLMFNLRYAFFTICNYIEINIKNYKTTSR